MNLVIRADSGVSVGSGHVMRCLALAQAWLAHGGHVCFVTALPQNGLEARLQAEGLQVRHLVVEPGSPEDSQYTAEVARSFGAQAVIVDGYQFSDEFEDSLKQAGFWLMAADDFGHAEHSCADAILNQNLHAHEALYPNRAPSTRLLLGSQYALLRREFWKWRGWTRHVPVVVHKILVTLGGSDPDNVTLRILGALGRIRNDAVQATVVAGPSNPHISGLQSAIDSARLPIRLLEDITDMAALMAWAEIAVSAGGSTNWELAFMGLPSITVVLADNQHHLATKLAGQGVVRNLGWHSDVTEFHLAQALHDLIHDHTAREELSKQGRRLIDGRGSWRVAQTIKEALL